MPKIAFIGAGSLAFTRNLCHDILLTPELQGSTLSLMDVDPVRLARTEAVVKAMVEHRGLGVRVEATTDRREAVRRADYVVASFLQGGIEAYELDIQIPQRYGVEQCVGDTLGPGGVFRGLRTIPVMLDLCAEMDEVAPDALLINFVNPLPITCGAVSMATGRPQFGLCYSVQGTGEMLARWVDVPYDEVNSLCAGINHLAFFLQFRRGSEDLYPRLREVVNRPEIYGQDPIRIELMKYFGYFVTEASGHASEYVPYFRKTAQMVNEDVAPRFTDPVNHWYDFGRTGGFLRNYGGRLEHAQQEYESLMAEARGPVGGHSHYDGSSIIVAIETNRPLRINGNVPNTGLIANLPAGCCVEVPCLVDGSGVWPTAVGDLPAQLAGMMQAPISVQELTVQAALTGSVEAVYHAIALDPLTAAVCTLPQIRAMVDEMMVAQETWLPQFKNGHDRVRVSTRERSVP